MSRQIEILTPENVELTYELAGVGSRFMATLIDTMLQALATLSLAAAGALGLYLSERIDFVYDLPTWALAGGIVILFLIWWGYYVLFETVWSGQTPGKRSMGLRVIQDQGFPVDFRAVLIRNLVRLADMLPLLYGIGVLFVWFHPQYKRLGDLAAGTLVIREREEEPIQPAPSPPVLTPSPTPGNGPALKVLNPATVSLSNLTRHDLEVAKRYLERRGEIDQETQRRIARQIALPLLQKLDLREDQINSLHTPFLEDLVLLYERKAGII